MAKPKRQTTKTIKKKWYGIESVGHFNNVRLGESYLDDPQKLVGKVMDVNLMNITGNIRQQHITLTYAITELEGDIGKASWRGMELAPTYIKRLVRRRSTRIDHSFVIKSHTGDVLRIKPMVITRNLISTELKSQIRKDLTKHIVETLSEMSTDGIIEAILNASLQREIKKTLSTYSPIKVVEIRSFGLTKGGMVLTKEMFLAKKRSIKKISKTAKRVRAKSRPKQEEEQFPMDAE